MESGTKSFNLVSTVVDFVLGVSNIKAGFEGVFGVNLITGDKIGGWNGGGA
ncbi:pre-toxin TG domain-containing protein [Lysinibacillus odysseyi]|uniref:pre-toxin TG domain-containing protein n=1 Tax=Lysinibacillus odysseyi TaxID=202611 RepID=UPI0009DE5160|nr:pre-toxin TG domain-containing protein [Lysinibacillus odysseyi]